MRRQDLSPDRQQRLVPVEGRPNVLALVPPPTPATLPLEGVAAGLFRAHEALTELQGVARHLPNPDLITRTLERREAVQSSQIEGTRANVGELFEFEATGDLEGMPPDVAVTLNYVKALDAGLARVRAGQGTQALDDDLVREMHRELMAGIDDYEDVPGEYRQRQNRIGGNRIEEARFVPPPPACVPEAMADLVRFLQYEPDGVAVVSIVMRMAIAHAQFETIHPFRDGNGRVGRLLMPLMLAAEGYPPIYLAGYLKSRQRHYYDALLAVQLQGEWTEWVNFLSHGAVVACRDAGRIARGLITLRDGWQERVADLRADAGARRLVPLLIGHPVLTVRKAEELLGVSFVAANAAVEQLVARGIMEPTGQQRRNRVFAARDVIELLARVTADDE